VKRSAMIVLAAVMFAFLAAGCNKFIRPRYDTIYVGQPKAEVRNMLGRPDKAVGNAWGYVHDEPFYNAVIVFEKGHVARKLWSNSRKFSVPPAPPKPPSRPAPGPVPGPIGPG